MSQNEFVQTQIHAVKQELESMVRQSDMLTQLISKMQNKNANKIDIDYK